MELEGLGQQNEINNKATKPVPKIAEGLQLQKEKTMAFRRLYIACHTKC